MGAKNEIDLEQELLSYKGDDEIISSFDMQKLLASEQRPEVKIVIFPPLK